MATYRKRQIGFLSTYPPRECGLATFTSNLTAELDKIQLLNETKIISISMKEHKYDKNVIFDIQQDDLDSYLAAAKAIKDSKIDLLSIQHEFGIYGGYCGDFLVDFLSKIEIPVVSTMHTVIPEPNSRQRFIINRLGEKSSKIVTMAKNTINTLVNTYGVDQNKIIFIPHGVPFRILPSRDKLKAKYGLGGKQIISTFGLISPGKGLENGIEAMARIKNKFNDAIYLILGQTHPVVKKQMGEVYRESLQAMVQKFGLENNVLFVDKYLNIDELLEYLKLSDIYMTPYLGKDQAVSGTLAYAVGYGKAIVSTPYIYAQEVLDNGRGLLAEFKNPDSLAECIEKILSNPIVQEELEYKTKTYGKNMMWKNVASSYTKTFIDIIESGKMLVKDA
ncbi:MAG: glycosyltransferase family 4 protein [Deltaproteobacteria bacterium]